MFFINKFGSLSQREIIDIESRFNIHLSEDYKDFLINTNGGTFKSDTINSIHIDSLDEDIYLDVLFGITDDENLNIFYWNEKYSNEMLEKTVLIGFDLMQGFIVLMCGGENNGIYYWDDSYNFNQSNDKNNMYFIAKDFKSFYNSIIG